MCVCVFFVCVQEVLDFGRKVRRYGARIPPRLSGDPSMMIRTSSRNLDLFALVLERQDVREEGSGKPGVRDRRG
jgi:hypothetical protein